MNLKSTLRRKYVVGLGRRLEVSIRVLKEIGKPQWAKEDRRYVMELGKQKGETISVSFKHKMQGTESKLFYVGNNFKSIA